MLDAWKISTNFLLFGSYDKLLIVAYPYDSVAVLQVLANVSISVYSILSKLNK
jgi:hypothetical protein